MPLGPTNANPLTCFGRYDETENRYLSLLLQETSLCGKTMEEEAVGAIFYFIKKEDSSIKRVAMKKIGTLGLCFFKLLFLSEYFKAQRGQEEFTLKTMGLPSFMGSYIHTE